MSEDARCRLSLDDRVLGGLIRDTIARVHGAFGAAACSVGFAGTRAPQTGCGARFAGRPGPRAAFCTIVEGPRKAGVRRVRTEQKVRIVQSDRGKKFNTQPWVCVPGGIQFTARISGGRMGVEFTGLNEGSHVEFLVRAVI